MQFTAAHARNNTNKVLWTLNERIVPTMDKALFLVLVLVPPILVTDFPLPSSSTACRPLLLLLFFIVVVGKYDDDDEEAEEEEDGEEGDVDESFFFVVI